MSSIRIARERSLYQSFDSRALQSQQAQIARLREQVASQQRVNRPSDDPSAFGQARQMEHLLGRYETHLRTIESSKSWVNQTEQALGHLVEILTQASEEGVRAANDSRSASDRGVIATRLESLLGEAVDAMNTRHGNEYLFAGNRTGLRPFGDDGTPESDPADIAGARMRDIGPDASFQINISGAQLNDVPSGNGLAGTLHNLIDAVRSGDTDQMQSALADIESAREHITGLVGETGNTARRLSLAEANIRDASLLAESRRSQIEDADLLETMLSLQQAETGLQAALQVTARTLQHSILDFLR